MSYESPSDAPYGSYGQDPNAAPINPGEYPSPYPSQPPTPDGPPPPPNYAQQQYAQQQYAPPPQAPYYQPGYYPGPMPAPTNGMAIASLSCSVASFVIIPLIGAILGVIFGHMALGQINASNGREQGRGMAQAGLIIGYIHLGLFVLVIAIVILFIIIGIAASGTH